jgi:hypothetical protein
MFITYTHVDQIRSKEKKFQVQSFQNRRRHQKSKPPKTASRHVSKASSPKPVEDLREVVAPVHTLIGSLRRDPFDAWPMEPTSRVRTTVDYCRFTSEPVPLGRPSDLPLPVTQVYAPVNAQNYRDSQGNNWLLSYYFRLSLQADLLFEANVLFIWAQLPPDRFSSSAEEHERALISLRGNVIRKLHHRLSIPELSTDDTTIHTVLSLMAGDVSDQLFRSVGTALT